MWNCLVVSSGCLRVISRLGIRVPEAPAGLLSGWEMGSDGLPSERPAVLCQIELGLRELEQRYETSSQSVKLVLKGATIGIKGGSMSTNVHGAPLIRPAQG